MHPGDIGLAELAFDLAELRNALAGKFTAPPQAKQAHMHLLLALENTAASFDARVRGDDKKAAQRMAAARAEEQTLHLALEAAKMKIPRFDKAANPKRSRRAANNRAQSLLRKQLQYSQT